MINNPIDGSRKSLLERLASLRIQNANVSPQKAPNISKAPESPRYIPRSTQTNTKSKAPSTVPLNQNDLLSSPTIGRRRKLTGIPNGTTSSTTTPIGMSSPKYFPKQKGLEIEQAIKFSIPKDELIFEEGENEKNERASEGERRHSVKEVVTSFIDSFTILNNFLNKSTNSMAAKLQLQNMNNSFAALQMDLKVLLSKVSNLQKELKGKSLDSGTKALELKDKEFELKNIEISLENRELELQEKSSELKEKDSELKQKHSELKEKESEIRRKSEELNRQSTEIRNAKSLSQAETIKNIELEEQLKIALSQIGEIKIAHDKEKENVEFLQNYMEEIIQIKDENETKLIKLENNIKNFEDIQKENEALEETIRSLKTMNLSTETTDLLKEELKLKQIEIEKLRSRENHFKESNEIFQQKLIILTEENRGHRARFLPHMARLFTTKPASDDLEIVLDAPETENIESSQNINKMTVNGIFKNKTNVKNKLTGTWIKLLALPPQELVPELKAIHEHLSPIDQDHVDRSELIGLADQLASPGLIKHKDRAVRILTACCIANILRLFAPDAPYSIDQFEMIFNLFLHQLKGISEPEGIYYNYHYFLLESLSTVKSVVLIFDLPHADILQREIVQMALEMIHPTILKNVRLYLLELVQTVLDECDQVPVELISDLFVPHLSSNCGNNNNNELVQAFIHDLVKQSADKLQGPLAIHFSEQLGRVARAQESETVLTRVTRDAHEFAVHVAKLSIPAASSILSLLDEELKVEAQEIRFQSISSLSQIFTHHHARLSSLQSLWSNWLGRRSDKSPRCRIAWIRGALDILNVSIRANNLSISDQLVEMVVERLQDPDEKVRLASIQSISMELLPVIRCSAQQFSTTELVEALTDRCLDRKTEVQSAALSLCSDWLFTLVAAGIFTNVDLLIRKLLQLPFSESRIHSIAFLGFLEREVFVRMAREFPDVVVRAEKLTELLKCIMSDERSHSAYRALLRHKSQFLKAWTALLKLTRLPDSALTDVHRVKTIQVCQFVAEKLPGVPELEAQRALLSLSALKNSHSDAILMQMMIDLAEGRVSNESASILNLLSRIEAHLKASTSISISLKKVITAALPFGSQVSLNTALIGQLTSIPDASLVLQDLLSEFPQLFENRTVELISAVTGGGSSSAIVALSQYLSNPASSKTSCDRQILNDLDVILMNSLHPPLGCAEENYKFEPKTIGSSAQVLINLERQNSIELVQDLVFQLAQEEKVQIKSALAGLTGFVKIVTGNSNSNFNSCSTLVPHFETIFELISHRLFVNIPKVTSERNNKKLKPVEGDLLAGWPSVNNLSSDFQIPVLCVRFLAAFVSALIRQHTRKQQDDSFLIDLDTVSSIRSISVGFFLMHLQELGQPASINVNRARLQYSLLKGLMTCLPDASASDLTSHLQPLFLALQDTDQRLRYKLSTLLSRLIRNRRLSDAFLPLLFFAGAHETSLLIKSTLKALLNEIIRSWPADSVVIEELLPVLIVYTVKHPDYNNSDDFGSNRDLIKGYFEHFVDNVVDSGNCGTIYEAVSRLKLYRFAQDEEDASRRLYFASEWAQEAIKDRCSSHHWPLQSITREKSSSSSSSILKAAELSLLVPDVLVELEEAAQLQNIHRVFSEISYQSDPNHKSVKQQRVIKRK